MTEDLTIMPNIYDQRAPGSRRQYVEYDEPIGVCHMHMRPEAFTRLTGATFSTFPDLDFESARDWFFVANSKPGGFCFL